MDSGIQRHRMWTSERGRNTEVNKDREKLLKKQRRNSEYQRLRELTKQRGGTTAEAKDKENGATKRKKDSGN